MRKNRAVKSTILFVALFFLSAVTTAAYADYQTSLTFQGYIQSGSGDLDAELWSVPTVYDWDSDGAKDLIVGRKVGYNGFVSFYKNYGTDAAPVFNGYNDIQQCQAPVCSNVGG